MSLQQLSHDTAIESGGTPRSRRLVAALAALVVSVSAVIVVAPASTALAGDEAPVVNTPDGVVSADALPTVQIDRGVVWAQTVIGNTVFAGGDFQNARPAGAAAGTNLVPRRNLLAYDIRTGQLLNNFDPVLNGQVTAIAPSTDGSRIYVVGDFTTVDGVPRRRVAAISATTGELITSFNPVGVNSHAAAVAVSDGTVYVGGSFIGAGSAERGNLAAFRTSDGALVNWAPMADKPVLSMAVSDDGSAVFAGGRFVNVNDLPNYGLAKIDGSTGAVMPWAATNTVRNGGDDAGNTSLRVHNGFVYGTGYHFGAGGNLEGNFKASVGTGEVEWVTNCFGDSYDNFIANDIVYSVGHSHYCGDIGGGFTQTNPWSYQHLMAFTDEVAGEHLTPGQGRTNWRGRSPSPSIVDWIPVLSIGSYTGQYQAGWTIDGNDDYVVVGGEFERANYGLQQGLVRYARRPLSPQAQGPLFPDTGFVPTLRATSNSSIEVSWRAGYDRDDYALDYRVIRDSTWSSPAYQTMVESNWWKRPQIGFVDEGLTPGQEYRYQLVATDSSGNAVYGGSAYLTLPTDPIATSSYADQVLADGARLYWPLNETAGATVVDAASYWDGQALSNVSFGVPGAISGDSAVALSNSNNSRIYSVGTEWGMEQFTAQVWINTTTSRGGRIFGFGDNTLGNSGHRDRQVWMNNSGQLLFGIRGLDNSERSVRSTESYNDGQWHQITATLGADGMKLYVDGVRVGARSDTTTAENYLGYWRLGGDNMGSWSNGPSQVNFTGSVDEFAVYPTALSQSQIVQQYELTGRTSVVPPSPADAYGAAVYEDDPDLYWRFAESNGVTVVDSSASLSPGRYRGGFTLGEPGAIDVNTATTFDGSDGFAVSDASYSNPRVYSQEAWFNTTTTSGGKIIGFGNSDNGTSSSYDRHIYMRDDGRLVFGVWTGQENVIVSDGAFNDGEWHHVVSTQSSDGMKLYVDGVLVGTNPQTSAQNYTGFWRVGGDRTWGGASSDYFSGTIDEVAVYSKALTEAEIQNHYVLGGGTVNLVPMAAFTTASDDLAVAFDASTSSDDDGTIVAYDWDFGDGTTGVGEVTDHVYAADGTFTVTLTVTDDEGATATATADVTVIDTNVAPLAGFGVTTGDDLAASFDGSSSSDDDGTVVSYDWDFGDGDTAIGVTVDHVYDVAGTYTVTLVVTDDDGKTGEVMQDVTVPTPNESPTASFTSSVVDRTASFDASASTDPDGTIASFDWDFGDGMTASGAEPDASHTYATAGTYMVTLTVTDDDGATSTTSDEITAVDPNAAPTADIDVDVTDLDVVFDGTGSSDGDGTVVSYDWDFGDGTSASGPTPSHSYGAAGTYTVTLTVTDDDGASATASTDVVTTAPNMAPTASFTSDVTDLDASFDATGSFDDDGTVVSYGWDFGDGNSATGVTPSHTYATAGSYTVTLTVTDDDGATSTTSATVTVTAPNQAPTASFTSTSIGLDASFDATGSFDDDGTVVSYGWDFGDGNSATGVTPSHTYATAGSYTVTLTVTDDDGATDVSARQVTVAPANQAPSAEFAADIVDLDLDVDATASSDADGTIASFDWDFGDGTSGTGELASHSYATAGTYTVTLTVTDDDGATSSSTVDVAATAPNQAPTASFTTSANGLEVAFDPSASADDDGTIVSYSWNFGDGVTSSESGPVHAYATSGTYTVSLTVTDDDGATDVVIDQVTVAADNQAPTAAFTSSVVDLTASFNASTSSDADGSIVAYGWDFGDGNSATGANPTHTYATAGTFSVTLTVTDDDGATDTLSSTVTASAPNQAPTAQFVSDASDLQVSFDASGSSDPDGTVSSYSWTFGDGGSATGVAPTHTFAAAGTYTVTLTVTDDDGATGTTNAELVVTDSSTASIAADTFERSVTNGLGTADRGGPWTTTTAASNFAVANGVATVRSAAGSGPLARLADVSAGDVDATVQLSFDAVPSDGSMYSAFRLRNNGSDDYKLLARFHGDYTILYLQRSQGATTTTLATYNLPNYVYSVGDVLNVRFRVDGASTASLMGKLWVAGQAEPAGWMIEAVDSAALPAGGVGISNYLSGGVTNGPIVTSIDNLDVIANGNLTPVAQVAIATNGLDVDVDGSASSDVDGSIASYSWNFGDGATANGAVATHTYAAGGTYTVTLIVTDNAGATASTSRDVTVQSVPANVVASDSFNRSVSGGFGSANVGGAWDVAPATWYSVDGSAGKIAANAGFARRTWLNGVTARDVDATMQLSLDSRDTGPGFYHSLAVRRVGDSDYRLKVRITDSETVAYVTRTINGTETVLDWTTVAGLEFGAGDVLNLRLQATGTGTTTLSGKMWVEGTAEPQGWLLTATDTNTALQGPGGVGFYSYLSSASVVSTVNMTVDNFVVRSN